jgi:hypothetical protein
MRFGNYILRVGDKVEYITAGRKITGTVLAFCNSEWVRIHTAFKTHPVRTVSVRCNVRPVNA